MIIFSCKIIILMKTGSMPRWEGYYRKINSLFGQNLYEIIGFHCRISISIRNPQYIFRWFHIIGDISFWNACWDATYLRLLLNNSNGMFLKRVLMLKKYEPVAPKSSNYDTKIRFKQNVCKFIHAIIWESRALLWIVIFSLIISGSR